MDLDGKWIWRDFLNNRSISQGLAAILDRLVAPAPSQRYQTARAVLEDFNSHQSPSQSYIPQSFPQSFPQAFPQAATQLSQFSFETAIITVNRLGIGKFSQNNLQINTRQRTGRFYVQPLGNIQGKAIGLEMVLIPAGKFQIGSPINEVERSSEESPRHIVNIPSFLMSRFPITQRQWKVVMDNNPAIFIGNGDRPVETISWDEAQIFCQKLTERTDNFYRLPSESEWEYACRAGTITAFSFGETIAANLANFNGAAPYLYAPKGISNFTTTEVGTYPANGFGLHDMHGNVWEWCADHWHDDYDLLPQDGSAWTETGDHSCRVIRGGSWRDPAHYCRSAKRAQNAANQGDRVTGFRVAFSWLGS
jgi:formylglycine-generating enzyme required for sulfatase activity